MFPSDSAVRGKRDLNPLAHDWCPRLDIIPPIEGFPAQRLSTNAAVGNGLPFSYTPPAPAYALPPALPFPNPPFSSTWGGAGAAHAVPPLCPCSDKACMGTCRRLPSDAKQMYHFYQWFVHNWCQRLMQQTHTSPLFDPRMHHPGQVETRGMGSYFPPSGHFIPNTTALPRHVLQRAPSTVAARSPFGASGMEYCYLCGAYDHLYTACQQFDGTVVCFVNTMNDHTHAMRHESWAERATLRDVYVFIYTLLGLEPSGVNLHVRPNMLLRVEDCTPEMRCVDLHIFPGAVVGIIHRTDGPLPNAHPFATMSFMNEQTVEAYRRDPFAAHETTGRAEDKDEAETSTKTDEEREETAAEQTTLTATEGMNLSSITPATNSPLLAAPVKRAPERDARSSTMKIVTPNDTDTDTERVTDAPPPTPSSFFGKDTAAAPDVSVHARGAETTPALSARVKSEHDVLEETKPLTFPHRIATDHTPGDTEETEKAATRGNTSPDKAHDAKEEQRRQLTVHIKFIPVSTDFCAIRKLLWSCGEVLKVRLVKPRTLHNPKKAFFVCFVEYATPAGLEKALQLHGRRMADVFRLAVERSQQPIRGGYVTDFDAVTGKPCTFGLPEGERRRVEQNFPDGMDHSHKGDAGGPKGRKGESLQRPPQRASSPARGFHAGYELLAVSALGAQQRRPSPPTHRRARAEKRLCAPLPPGRATTAPSGTPPKADTPSLSAETPSTDTSGERQMYIVWEKPRRESVTDINLLCEQLRRVASLHMRIGTQVSFYATVVSLEDAKWVNQSAMFRATIARYEVALYLRRGRVDDAFDASRAAKDAVELGHELVALMTATASPNGEGGERERALRKTSKALWCALFTAVPLEEQTPHTEVDGGPHPCVATVMRFVQLLLHIALLFDEFQQRKSEEVQERCAVRLRETERGIWGCVRRLLMHTLAQIDETTSSAQSKIILSWRERIMRALQQLPIGDAWLPGQLMHALIPGISDLASVTLATASDMVLF